MIVVGIDPSLTATGVAIHGAPTLLPWHVATVKSAAPAKPCEAETMRRIGRILVAVDEIIVTTVRPKAPDLIVIEAPAYSKSMGMAHERAGLWWHLYAAAFVRAPILVVKPNLRAKYATGSGNAGKDEVMLAAARRYDDANITNNNECDAVVLAAMGARYLQHAVESSLPVTHLAAMKTLVYS